MRPAFQKDGTVTAGNASGINDGAAAIVLMSSEGAEQRGVEPLARIVSWATTGVDPAIMGTGPIPASQKALQLAGWSTDDLDLIEANEAPRSLRRRRSWTGSKVNIHGGAIALGHPIGASAPSSDDVAHTMHKRDVEVSRPSASAAAWVSPCVSSRSSRHLAT